MIKSKQRSSVIFAMLFIFSLLVSNLVFCQKASAYRAVCKEYGREHRVDHRSFEKFEYKGKIYNATGCTCSCGAKVYYCNYIGSGAYFFSGVTKKHGSIVLPNYFTYIVPDKIYSGKPSYWLGI